ncbi:hypothetical protein F0L68_31260 [Solihabitans fulvus]|uniref:Uncharacterized protein n=1 Tax=Solihabitans fulvus TaxID=1892852 RepID=A0A5B2WR01_9PSEU|nr:hypothetical protein [Solihabitans fulvus]KAA2254091.1 hypothetical protein F0L68_31260 [Solihabitans fulvus]
MSNLAFQHQGLSAAVLSDAMLLLDTASSRAGTLSPVDTLHYVDCDPPALNAAVTAVQHALEPYNNARDSFRAGQQLAKQHWSGIAASHFDIDATVVYSFYQKAIDATQRTVSEGAKVAAGLDQLATSTGSSALQIAQEDTVQQACTRVIAHGGGADYQDIEIVVKACDDVLALVQRAVADIPSIGAGLAALTQAVPTPNGWPAS